MEKQLIRGGNTAAQNSIWWPDDPATLKMVTVANYGALVANRAAAEAEMWHQKLLAVRVQCSPRVTHARMHAPMDR